jgi:hypothetical protein
VAASSRITGDEHTAVALLHAGTSTGPWSSQLAAAFPEHGERRARDMGQVERACLCAEPDLLGTADHRIRQVLPGRGVRWRP